MPKRKVARSAAQKAASRRNLVVARKKGRPHGKSIDMHHFTSPEAAGEIVKSGFKGLYHGKNVPRLLEQMAKSTGGVGNPVWLTKAKADKDILGNVSTRARVTVRVPFRKLKPDTFADTASAKKNWKLVDESVLKGRKVRRTL